MMKKCNLCNKVPRDVGHLFKVPIGKDNIVLCGECKLKLKKRR